MCVCVIHIKPFFLPVDTNNGTKATTGTRTNTNNATTLRTHIRLMPAEPSLKLWSPVQKCPKTIPLYRYEKPLVAAVCFRVRVEIFRFSRRFLHNTILQHHCAKLPFWRELGSPWG